MGNVITVININRVPVTLTAMDSETIQVNTGLSPVDSKFASNLPSGVSVHGSSKKKATPVAEPNPTIIKEPVVEDKVEPTKVVPASDPKPNLPIVEDDNTGVFEDKPIVSSYTSKKNKKR